MKTLLLADDINQFHWTVIKSVLFTLSLLPMSQFFLDLWKNTDASSQIIIGFMAISVSASMFIINFHHALNLTLNHIDVESSSLFERKLVHYYSYVPMLFLATMLSYLTVKFL